MFCHDCQLLLLNTTSLTDSAASAGRDNQTGMTTVALSGTGAVRRTAKCPCRPLSEVIISGYGSVDTTMPSPFAISVHVTVSTTTHEPRRQASAQPRAGREWVGAIGSCGRTDCEIIQCDGAAVDVQTVGAQDMQRGQPRLTRLQMHQVGAVLQVCHHAAHIPPAYVWCETPRDSQ